MSELVSRGEVELGIVVITQILTTPGVELAGPLPADLQRHITFTGGISESTADLEGASALLAALRSPEAARVMRVQGMEPGARAFSTSFRTSSRVASSLSTPPFSRQTAPENTTCRCSTVTRPTRGTFGTASV